MSGGHFDYKQYSIDYIVDDICDIIRKNNEVEWYGYSEETITEFKKGIDILQKAAIYAQRIDWLVSGDDSEMSFHKRLEEDLFELENKSKDDNEH